jgi:hypothetical protein
MTELSKNVIEILVISVLSLTIGIGKNWALLEAFSLKVHYEVLNGVAFTM